MAFPYSYCRASGIVAVITTFNVFSYDQDQHWNTSPPRQHALSYSLISLFPVKKKATCIYNLVHTRLIMMKHGDNDSILNNQVISSHMSVCVCVCVCEDLYADYPGILRDKTMGINVPNDHPCCK